MSALAIEHGAGAGQRHLEPGQMIGTIESVIGPLAQLQIFHALAQIRGCDMSAMTNTPGATPLPIE